MASGEGPLTHLLVRGGIEQRDFTRPGGGDPKIRDVEHRAHGTARRRELTDTIDDLDVQREARRESVLDELRALGVTIVLEGENAGFPLKLDSLESWSTHRKEPKRPRWLLLSVMPAANGRPEQATVWVSDPYRGAFMKLFDDYLEKTRTDTGRPYNRTLVANIGRIRRAVLDDLWQSDGSPTRGRSRWWELWLVPSPDAVALLSKFATERSIPLAGRVLRFADRTVTWIRSTWDELEVLPFTSVPLAEIREPEFVDTVEDLGRDDQDALTSDLAERIRAAHATAPAVCHLDTGVRQSHLLLRTSLATTDVHSIFGDGGSPTQNHGTLMAGLGLLGPLDADLLSTGSVVLEHRLESVKILPDRSENDPLAYGLVTAQAVALPEATIGRSRVFCLPVTAPPERMGEPSLWSASVDALAAGVGVTSAADGIGLLGRPDPAAARLFFISVGNVDSTDFRSDYRDVCDLAPIQDPAQAWNALAVGAYTDLVARPEHPDFAGWTPVAERGDISPHSRTSLLFGTRGPIKPDICMEGGNLLADGTDAFDPHPLLCVRTTDVRDDLALSSTCATSAATAQAARLGALAQARYPALWPESVRGLIVHAAEWTSTMREEIELGTTRTSRLQMLRRYGWGVPSEDAVLSSSRTAVTMITQDSFKAFSGDDFKLRHFRLHRLPWPVEVLTELGATPVTMRVTLSYFIEPTASRRGWRRRYSYASHGLRFELKTPTESVEAFVQRVNQDAQTEEDGAASRRSSGSHRWFIGPNQRNTGSLHQDLWEGTAADLAASGVLAVNAIGGWWKSSKNKDRIDLPVRYALVVSLKTAEQGIDLYTPIEIANEQLVPTPTDIPIG